MKFKSVELTGIGTFLYDKYEKVQHYPKYRGKSRRTEIVLNRLRIGHAGLNQYLNRFNMGDSPLCSACLVPETIEHLLLYCNKYTRSRYNMLQDLKTKNIWPITVSTLLGSSPSTSNDHYHIVKSLITFLRETNTLSFL